MSPFQCFVQHCHCVTTGYGSTCPFLLIDSDTANWQLQNVSGQSRSRARGTLAKYEYTHTKKRFLKEQLETTEWFIVSQGPIKSNQHAHFLLSAPSARLPACPQTAGGWSRFHEWSALSDCLRL